MHLAFFAAVAIVGKYYFCSRALVMRNGAHLKDFWLFNKDS
jgi:hypothetical protein